MHEYICRNPHLDNMTDDEKREATKEKLINQLRKFRAYPTAGGRSVTFGGKCGADGKVIEGQNDDLCLAFILCNYLLELFHREKIPFFPYAQVLST